MSKALRPRKPSASAGFTLLEVLVAFAVLSVALAVLFQVFAQGFGGVQRAEGVTGALLRAESRLAEIGRTRPLEAGEDSGDFGDGYRWHTVIRAHGEDTAPPNAPLLRAFEVLVRIDWRGARGQGVELRTLRLAPGLEP